MKSASVKKLTAEKMSLEDVLYQPMLTENHVPDWCN